MASDHRSDVVFVYNLPYEELKLLCRTLDFSNKWEELGGKHMKFDMMTIHELRRSNSPTEDLLALWGIQNHTVKELFVLLSKMQHYQAMLILKPFVEPRFHSLIYEGEGNLSRYFGGRSGQEKPTSPQNTTQKPPEPEAPQLQEVAGATANVNPSELPGPSNPLLDKNMNVGSHNLNVSMKLHHAAVSKVVIPGEQEERKILNSPPVILSDDDNNIGRNNNHSPAPMQPPPSSMQEGAVAQMQAENKENNAPLPNSQRKMSNASDASSVAEYCCTIPQIPYKELMMATGGWSKNAILGKGGFGTVFKGIWKNTQVAIKRIEQRGTESTESYQAQMEQSLRELRILNACRHDNILPLYGYSMGGEEPCLVYQFMPNGSLEDRLLCRQGTTPLTWTQRHNIAEGTARGLQFLHTNKKPFIHGDIKSANILLDTNFEPRIGDFGLAREGPQNHYTHMKVSRVHGTRPYLPDEFLRSKQLSTKVDTYSFGVVLFELATGLRAYDDSRPTNKLLKDHVNACEEQMWWTMCDAKAGPYDEAFLYLVALGKRCVSQRTKDRPEMEEVLKLLMGLTEHRTIVNRAKQLVHQNSPTPTNPYERQVLQDYQSGFRPSTSPVPYQVPLSVSPEPISRNAMAMGMPNVIHAHYHQQPVKVNRGHISPLAHPLQPNNPFFYHQPIIHPEDLRNSMVEEDRLMPNRHMLGISKHEESGKSGNSTGNSANNYREISAASLPQTLPNGTLIIPSDRPNATGFQNDQNIPTVVGSFTPNPVIAVSPPSSDQVSPFLSATTLPGAIATSQKQGLTEDEVPPCADDSDKDKLPLLSALGIKDPSETEIKTNIALKTEQISNSISQTSNPSTSYSSTTLNKTLNSSELPS